MLDYKVVKLTEELLPDYIDFFDNRAFTDNKEWSACYCVFFHWNEEYKKSAKVPGIDIHEHNRNLAADLIKKGILQGYLAYSEGKAVGWVNANDKEGYETLNKANRPELWDDESNKIKSITCFSIAPEYRRKGIAKALLSRVCEDAKKDGYDFAEAYVRTDIDPKRNYHGPGPLYEKAGFTEYRKIEKETIVRKEF